MKWIKTSDKMPPEGQAVLCALYGVQCPVMLIRCYHELDNEHQWYGSLTANADACVHSWMTLPEKPADLIEYEEQRKAKGL